MKLFLNFVVFIASLILYTDVKSQGIYPDSIMENYERRIKLTHINGVYIPVDVEDAMAQLDILVDRSSREKYRSVSEGVAVRKLHFSFGLWMIVNWGFYEGSRLSHYLKSMGISYPDDMARTLMICYHRRLNGEPLELEQLASYFSRIRKEELDRRLNKGEVIQKESIEQKP